MVYRIFFLLSYFYISLNYCDAQQKKIELNEVVLNEKSLPSIEINGKEYSFKGRDDLVKGIFKSKFWIDDIYIKLDLVEFYNETKIVYEIQGKIKVFIDDREILKNNSFKKIKAIKELNRRIKHFSFQREKNETLIKIKT
tara:strand:- start:343 stop:762 length:420 start_codon:yes stop_codon:yes gene_type:complete